MTSTGRITLTAPNGRLVCVESDNSVRAFGTSAETRCQFEEIGTDNNYVSLRANNGRYVCPVNPSKYLYATAEQPCHYAVE